MHQPPANELAVHIDFAQSDQNQQPRISSPPMQTEFTESQPRASSTAAPESHSTTTQDGIRLPEPGSTYGGSQPPSRDVSPGLVAAGASLSERQLDEALHRLSGQEERVTLPGERISAYENAVPPNAQQLVGFKVVKRSGPSTEGPWLTDFPNGALL